MLGVFGTFRCAPGGYVASFLYILLLIAAALSPASAQDISISGVVRDAGTQAPLEGVRVVVFVPEGESVDAFSDASGVYQVAAPTGASSVFAIVPETDQYAEQRWPDISTGQFGDPQEIDLSAGSVSGVDFNLLPGFIITGSTIDSRGDSVRVSPSVIKASNDRLTFFGGTVGSAEGWETPRIVPGDYKLLFSTNGSYDQPDRLVDQLYEGVSCVQGYCDIAGVGDPVSIVDQDIALPTVTMEDGVVIKGEVSDEGTGVPVPNDSTWVLVFSGGQRKAETRVVDGQFVTPALPPGTYRVSFESARYLRQFFGESDPCGNTCDSSFSGSAIVLDGSQDVLADIALTQGGSLSATLVDGTTAAALDGSFELLGSNGDFNFFGVNTENGVLDLGGLEPGVYMGIFRSSGYIDRLFGGSNCPFSACDRSQLGQTFEIRSGENTDLGEIRLDPGAVIEGTLTGSDGAPVSAASVVLYDAGGKPVLSRRSDENGEYRLDGLPASPEGGYRLKVEAESGYLPHLYQGRDCETFCRPEEGSPITLAAGEQLAIDITLQQAYAIAVNAFDIADPEAPIESACLGVFSVDGLSLGGSCAENAGGVFRTPPLLPGQYKLVVDPYQQSSQFLSQLYSEIVCGFGCSVVEQGSVIEIQDQDVQIDMGLTRGGSLSASLLDALSGDGIDGRFELLDPASGRGIAGFEAVDGVLSQDGLPPGIYKAGFLSDGYVGQLFDGVTCPDLNCDRLQRGRTFEVLSGQDTNLGEIRLDPGAVIEGTLTGSDGAAVSAALVRLYDAVGNPVLSRRPDENGDYRLDGLPASPEEGYRLKVEPDSDYLPYLYQGQDCTSFCPPAEGDSLPVAAGEQIVLNVTLQRAPSIIVNAFERGRPDVPVETACLDVYTEAGQFVNGRCETDAGGVFQSPPLLAGDYKIQLNPYGNSIRQARTLFPGITCLPGCDLEEQGSVVSVGANEIEVELPVESVNLINGFISDASGNPLKEVSVVARPVADPDQRIFLGSAFNDDGTYALRIPDGDFFIEFWPFGQSNKFIRQVFPGIACTPLGCDRSGAQVFRVAGNDIEVSPTLALGARIAGSIAQAGDTQGVSSFLFLFTRDQQEQWGQFAPDGTYSYAAVPPGDYWLAARSNQAEPALIDQIFDGKNCPSLDCDFEQTGDVLSLQAGDDLQIDFALELAPKQTISGIVTERGTNLPLDSARVDVIGFDFSTPVESVQTDQDGRFSVELLEGDYALVIEKPGYITRVFDSQSGSEQDWCPARRCFGFPGRRFSVADQPLDLGVLPMDPGGLITGTISLPDGEPARQEHNIRVEVYDASGNSVFGLSTFSMPFHIPNAEGTFALEVPPGQWHLRFEPFSFDRSLIPVALGGRLCPGSTCAMETTTAVEVNQGQSLTPAEVPQLAVTLSDGAALTGILSDGDNGGSPLPRGSVFVYNELGQMAGNPFINQNSDGIFDMPHGLPDGTYFVSTRYIDPSFSGSGVPPEFVDVLYEGDPCVSDCVVTTGTPIEIDLQSGILPPLINIELFRGVTVSGSVLRADDNSPVAAEIQVFDADGDPLPGTFVQDDGTFTVGGLLPGDYYLRTRNFVGLEDVLWNGQDPILCAPFCAPVDGTPVTVLSGGAVEGIDFVLSGAGSINGLTLGSDASPLGDITIEVYNAIGSLVGSTVSDPTGAWQVGSLPAGEFYVRTRNQLGLVNVAWEGLECTGCDVTRTTAITLNRGESRADVDLVLDTGATLSGTVTRQVDASPVTGLTVDVFTAAGQLLASAQTGSNGAWSVEGLGAGDYRLATRGSLGLVNQVHPGINCIGPCDATSGSLIELAIGQSETVDFALEAAARIAGLVADADDVPLPGVSVQAFSAGGLSLGQTSTDNTGRYEISGLVPGEVYLRTNAGGNYTDQTFNNRDCIPICDVTGSDPVTVEPGDRIGNINFALTFGGGLAGRVIDASEQQPEAGLAVEIYNALGALVASPITDADGQFGVRGLAGGRYFARTRNSRGLVDEVFDGFSCTPFPCSTGLGTPLQVGGGLIEGINFALEAGSELNGTVTDQFSNPLPTGEVVLFDEQGREVKRGPITDGTWRLTGIANGTYFAVVLNGSGLIDELYQRLPCPGGRCDVTQGTPITVPQASAEPAGSDRTAREPGTGPLAFVLERGSRITGILLDPDGNPLANATVSFFNADGELVGSSQTDGLGEFISGAAFSAGDYYVATTDGEARGVTTGSFVNVAYREPDSLACPLSCDVTRGTAVSLDGQFDSSQLVLRVLDGGALSGRAVDGSDRGLVGAQIEIFDAQGRLVGLTSLGTDGNWEIDGLPDGGYTVVVRNDLISNLDDVVVGAGFCDGDCDPSVGTVFTISGGEPDSDVDIILAREDVIFQSRFQAD